MSDRNPLAIDDHVQEKQDIFTALQCMKASDPALDSAENRAMLRKLLGIKEKPVVITDPRYSKIPDTPIRAREAIVAYLERGYSSVQPYSAGSSSPSGKAFDSRHLSELKSSSFTNVPMNAGLGLLYNDSLVIEFDESTVPVFEKFKSDVDELASVPIVIAKHKRSALLRVPHGFRLLHGGGKLPGFTYVRAFSLSNFQRQAAPPGYDRDTAGLTILTWANANETVPVYPSAKLTKYLSTVAMVLERTQPENAS